MEFTQKQQEQLNKIFVKNQVILAYIFGSAAKKELKDLGPLSDMDFAILFDKKVPEKEYFNKELRIASEIDGVFHVDRTDVINLKTVNHPLLKHNAVFDGRPIFIKDIKIRLDLEIKIMQEYEDTNYLRKTTSKIILRQIKDGTFGTVKDYVTSK